ncbi:hypothetical protein ABZ345_32590 [Lentzea sp. NPDC005914]|uniref:hypothetical protein n=1 Tax=Lentzea sp. NPDC005914 TaxID=3154572 RepID=UPI0033D65B9E
MQPLQRGCDNNPQINAKQPLADLLRSNPLARLVILAGETTEDRADMNGPYAHRGIQEVYFPLIRGTDLASRVLVCNYTKGGTLRESHRKMFADYSNRMDDEPLTSCPDGAWGWHP